MQHNPQYNTKLTIGCHLSSAGGYQKMGETALSIQARTFAFFTRNPRGGKSRPLDREDAAALQRLMAEHGMGPLVAHAPYTMNPCSATKKTREFAFLAMKEDLEHMEALPGNYYNMHPGSHTGQGMEAGIEQIAEVLNACLRPEQQTVVLLETMSGKGSEVGGRFQELAAILERVQCQNRIGICLDSCHVSDAGYDIIHDLDGVLQEFDRVIGLDRLKAIHLNDSKNPPGSHKDRHERIGRGTLGKETFRRLIHHPALRDLPMILETPNEVEGYAAEIKMLREMAE